MPFKSKKQKKWMYANKPDLAKKWEEEEKEKKRRAKKKAKRDKK